MELEQPEQSASSQGNSLQGLLRFLRVVNRHKLIIVGFVAAACFLAVVKHNRQPQIYEAGTKMLVRQTGSDMANFGAPLEAAMAGYKHLMLSDKSLTQTAENLDPKPPELSGVDSLRWPGELRKMLTVKFNSASQDLTISCRSRDPESTVAVIEALQEVSEQFIEDYQTSLTVTLMNRLQEDRRGVETKLIEKNKELLEERRDCGDIVINKNSTQSHPLVERVGQINQRFTELRSQRLELEAAMKSARRLVATQADLTPAVQALQRIVGPEVMQQVPGRPGLDVKAIETLEDKLNDEQGELSVLRRHYGSGHPEIISRTSKIQLFEQRVKAARADLDRRLQIGIRGPEAGQWLMDSLQAELNSIQQFESSLQEEYNEVRAEALNISNKLASIDFKEREIESLTELRSSLLNRLNSIKISENATHFKVAVLSDAMVPRTPSLESLNSRLIFYCVLAVMAAMGMIYVLDLMDDRLRTPEDVQDELGLPVLGIIRRLPEEQLNQCKIYLEKFAQTVQAEAFRTLKTAVTLTAQQSKCLAVTSTDAGEGKTVTTVNLAASFAQTGQKTLLIDADMRRPGLSRLLEVRGNGGLSEILQADGGIAELASERVTPTDVDGLYVLPCGPRILNAGTLLSMPALSELLDWAVANYDQVIVDCPPSMPVSDAAIVGRYVDGLLYLMNPAKTHRRMISRTVDTLRSLDLTPVGVVVNMGLSSEKEGQGYGYGYGYESQYGYGHDEDDDEYDQMTDGELAA